MYEKILAHFNLSKKTKRKIKKINYHEEKTKNEKSHASTTSSKICLNGKN